MKLNKVGDGIIEDFLRVLNQQFYSDGPRKAFFHDRALLTQAITEPATYLWERGIRREFAEEDYRKLVNHIIREIMRFGDTGNIRRFGRYFLTCMQRHLRHQGDVYYERAAAVRSLQADQALGIAMPKRKVPGADHTVEVLAQVAKIAANKRVKKKAPAPTQAEPDLFG